MVPQSPKVEIVDSWWEEDLRRFLGLPPSRSLPQWEKEERKEEEWKEEWRE